MIKVLQKAIPALVSALFLAACNSSGSNSLAETGSSTEDSSSCEVAETSSGSSEWRFDETGNTTSFMINGYNLYREDSGGGFYLVPDDGSDEIHLDTAETDGDQITVSDGGSSPELTFRVDAYARHISIHLIDVESDNGSDDLREYTVELRFNTSDSINHYDLNSLAFVGGSSMNPEIRWYSPWASQNDGQLGSVAIYYDGDDLASTEIDKALASVWMFEDLPVPMGQDCWNESAVISWVDEYHSQFEGISEVMLAADSLDDLYQLTDEIAIANEIDRVYLHTATWKFEYVSNNYSHIQVNTDVFPNGEDDLKAYADYLESNGIMLRLHYLTPGIGRNDPDRYVDTMDRRVASWGTGSLYEDIGASDNDFLFVPDTGVGLPEETRDYDEVSSGLGVNWFRIGEELIDCDEMDYDYDDNLWHMSGCTRSYGAGDAQSYDAGEEVVGLYSKWAIPLQYDVGLDESVMEEIAGEYGEFLERIGVDHIHFDGPDILNVHPAAKREFQNYVYRQISRPMTSSSVGSSIDANIEQQFTALRDDLIYNYFWLEVAFREEGLGSDELPATGWLDTQFQVQESIMKGGRRPLFEVVYSGQGISLERMALHGLADETLALFNDWQKLAPVLDDEDVAYIAEVTEQKEDSSRYESEYILVLSQNDDGDYIFTPRHIMGRVSGEDEATYVSQELGAVMKQQLIEAGTTLELTNPLAAQTLAFILSVDHNETDSLDNPVITIEGAASMTIDGSLPPGYYFEYVADDTVVKLYDENWNWQQDLNFDLDGGDFTVPNGSVSITVTDGNGSDVLLETEFIVDDEAYVLKTNENL
jgi:hypothetical protein